MIITSTKQWRVHDQLVFVLALQLQFVDMQVQLACLKCHHRWLSLFVLSVLEHAMSTSQSFHIAVLPGDGIGPEVCAEAVKVITSVGDAFGHSFSFVEAPVGGAAWDVTGKHLPDSTLEVARASDAVLFGSVGGPVGAQAEPKWKDAERNAILGLRAALGLAINLRPCKVFAQLAHLSPLKAEVIGVGVDIVIVRELLGGAYFGDHHTSQDGRFASDAMTYTWEQAESALRAGFEACVEDCVASALELSVCRVTIVRVRHLNLWPYLSVAQCSRPPP